MEQASRVERECEQYIEFHAKSKYISTQLCGKLLFGFQPNTVLSLNKCHCNKLQNRTFIAYFYMLLSLLHSQMSIRLFSLMFCVFLLLALKPRIESNILTTNTFQIVNLFGSKLSGYKSKSFCSGNFWVEL